MTERSNYPNEVEVRQRDLEFTESTKSRQIRQTRVDVFGSNGARAAGLSVTVSGVDATRIDVSAGRGYTPNGELVELAAAQTLVELSDYTDGVDNFACLVYTEVETTPAPHETDGTTRNARTEARTAVSVFTQAELDALPATLVDNTQQARDRVTVIATVNADGVGAALEPADITQPPLLRDLLAIDDLKLNRDGTNRVTGNILPLVGTTYDLGSPLVPFGTFYGTSIVLPGTSIASATGLGFVSCTELTVAGTPLGTQAVLINTPAPQLVINNSTAGSAVTVVLAQSESLASNRATLTHSPDGAGPGQGRLAVDVGGGVGDARVTADQLELVGALVVDSGPRTAGTLRGSAVAGQQLEIGRETDDRGVTGILFNPEAPTNQQAEIVSSPFDINPATQGNTVTIRAGTAGLGDTISLEAAEIRSARATLLELPDRPGGVPTVVRANELQARDTVTAPEFAYSIGSQEFRRVLLGANVIETTGSRGGFGNVLIDTTETADYDLGAVLPDGARLLSVTVAGVNVATTATEVQTGPLTTATLSNVGSDLGAGQWSTGSTIILAGNQKIRLRCTSGAAVSTIESVLILFRAENVTQ